MMQSRSVDDRHERFCIYLVDEAERLFRYITSDRKYQDASLVRDMLRGQRGGHWIIIDGQTGRVISDTREWCAGESMHHASTKDEALEHLQGAEGFASAL